MKKIISSVTIIGLLVVISYVIFEPEVIKGANIGVTQVVTGQVTLTCDASVSGLTSIPGVSGGTSNGTFSCTSTTNNDDGYNLKLKKTALLCHTEGCAANQQFDDYTGTTTDPIDFNWTDVGSGVEEWGFNMTSGDDVTDRFRNAAGPASPCNTGGGIVTAGQCWVMIPTTPDEETVANKTSPTDAAGSASGFGVRIQAGDSNFLRSGDYTTTLVATAAMN